MEINTTRLCRRSLFVVMQQVKQHHKAQTADNDKSGNNQKHIAAVVMDQGRVGPFPAQQVKTRIAKRGDGSKNGNKNAFCPVSRHKSGKQQ